MSRRRKQRSSKRASSRKAAPWQGWLLKGGGILCGVVIVALAVAYFWVKSYLRSDDFRQELSRQVGGAASGTAEFAVLDWEGSVMRSDSLTLESSRSGNWEVAGLEAELDLGGLWARVWRIPRIELTSARSEWDLRQQATPSAKFASRPTSPRKGGGESSSSGLLPNRAELLSLAVSDYEGRVLMESGIYQWERMRLAYEPGASPSEAVVTLRNGRLTTPMDWLGRLKLGAASLRARKGRVNLLESDWTLMERGQLELSGHWEDGGWLLEGEVVDLTCGELLPVNWQQKLRGGVKGDFVVEDSATSALAVNGSGEITDGVVGSLAFLDRLAAYAGSPSLQRLTFEEAHSDFSWQEGSWGLTNLVLSDEGLLRVEGSFRVEGEALDGRLRVGVPPGLLAHLPGAEEKVFLPGAKGLLWTPVRLTGTLRQPKEDLSGRMIQAAGERMFELIPETGQWALKFGGQAMDQGTAMLLENQGLILEEGQKAAEEVINQGGDVVEEGVKAGFGILDGLLGQ